MKLQALRLPAKNGMLWFADCVRLYRRNPIQLTAVSSAFLMVLALFKIFPFAGQVLLPLFLPSMAVIVGNACRMIDKGQLVRFAELFGEVGAQRFQLLRLGSLQLLITMLLLLLLNAMGYGEMPKIDPNTAPTPEQTQFMLQFMLVSTLISLPLLMAYWFAPFLAAWHDLPALKALFFSIVAVCRNWRAFLVYFLCAGAACVLVPGIIAGIFSLIPGIGGVLTNVVMLAQLFILIPIMIATWYVSYKDVFVMIEGGEASNNG